MTTIDNLLRWPRRADGLPRVPRLVKVVLADPAAFDVVEAINPHMRDPDGTLKQVDTVKARSQWEALATAYRAIGVDVRILPPLPGHADFCFAANPSMVVSLPNGGQEMWLSKMAHPSRRGEVPAFAAFARANGLTVREMPAPVVKFEGTGDGLFHPGRFLLHAGVGPRTDPSAWNALASAYPELDILRYELVNENFYHLDTALAPLDERSALIVREAFTPEGYDLVRAAFPIAFDVPIDEAMRFAANAHCPDGRHVLLQRGCARTEDWLTARGFVPIALDTDEFLKSGGSVFCLKLSW